MPKLHRLLHLTATSEIGGTERLLLYVLEHVDRSRFDIEIGSLIGSGILTERVQAMGFPAWNLGMKHPLEPGAVARLYHRLRAGRFDLVQLYGLRAETLGRPLAWLARVPVIISTIHSPDPWRRTPHVWLDRLTAPLVKLWISNSEAGRLSRIQRERFAPERIVTIHNGIPIPPVAELSPPDGRRRSLV